MEYTDHAYYTDTYHGSAVTESQWPRLSLLASAWIDRITLGQVRERYAPDAIPEEVKLAVCAVCDVMKEHEQGAVTSEKTLTYSLSRRTDSKAEYERALHQAAAAFLWPTGLLYAGVEMRC